jgi:transposase
LSIIKLSKIETILNYALQFGLQTKKVINFIENGGTITKADHTFGIGRASIYRWLSRPTLEANKVKSRQRKLDWKELEKDVKQNSQSKLSDKAKKIGVNQPAIFYALKRMNFP